MASPPLLRRLRPFLSRLNPNPNPRLLSTNTNFDPVAAPPDGGAPDDLKNRLLRLRFPKRSATAALQSWVSERGEAAVDELRDAVRELSRRGQYKHALEVSEWIKLHHEPQLSGNDYAVRIDLITRVFGINAAEEFFNGLSTTPAEAYIALLHSFAAAKSVDKAEALFDRMRSNGNNLLSDPLPFNELMTLYISVGEFNKVFGVIEQTRGSKVALDLYSYNLWISAHGALLDFKGVVKVLSEMDWDPNRARQWDVYTKLVRVYINVGRFESVANGGTKSVETGTKVGVREWITYDLLLILHASLGNKGRIKEMWRCMQLSSGRMTYRSYVCVISSLIAAGETEAAGEVVDRWKEAKELPEFDRTACCRLFEACVEFGLVDVAEGLRKLMQEKNCEIETLT